MKKVVIIGGGFAGSYAAKYFDNNKDFHVTFIDSKLYFEFTPGILRTIVEPGHLRKIQVMHTHYLHHTRLVVGTVNEVNRKEVIVGKEKIPFDHLVICSGSGYSLPIKEQHAVLATRAERLRDAHQRLEDAQKILIIGGGLVGVELAGEIVGKYRDKEIVLVHSGETLIERNHSKSIHYAEQFLRKMGVQIVYGERVKKSHGKKFITHKGSVYRADLALVCTGIVPQYDFMRKHFSSKLNDNHFLKVNEHLQLEGYTNIFVAGDITDRVEEKTAQNALRQAETVCKNICNLERGKELHTYHTRKRPFVISLGKYKGIFEYRGFVMTGFLPALMKWGIERIEMHRYR